MEVVVKQEQQNMKAKLYDLLVAISWADLSRTYFGKSSSWLYHKRTDVTETVSRQVLHRKKLKS